jgi:hypothetical protein
MNTNEQKTHKKPAANPKDKRSVGVYIHEGEDLDTAASKTYLKPTVTAALNIQAWNSQLSVNGLRDALAEQVEKVSSGDLSRPENILLCQAHTLDLLFNELAQKAQDQTYIPSFEAFLRLALKAQNQCRMTIETLSNIKNPPVVFAKQANISGGHQQINNGVPAQASHAKEIKKAPNELLTELPNETLDTGRTGAAIPVNSRVETVDKGRR